MVERFEEVTAGLITDHHGHVVKTIGDEVLFMVDDPEQSAQLALALLDEHEADDTFPAVRIGLAYGNVVNHMGDVFGPVVNVASRLTSLARPASALVDRALADELRDHADLRLKPLRRTSVKGYEHLQPWSLKRPRDEV
jgi:adenylate cyclase